MQKKPRFGRMKQGSLPFSRATRPSQKSTLKIQQQMEDLIAEREYADKADFDILASLIADSSRSGKRCCTAAGADAKVKK